MTGEPSGSTRFHVLIVCTANQCRSPMAEHLLRHALNERGIDWEIASAGTRAHDGQPMNGAAAVQLARLGLTVSGWRSQALTLDLVDRADLVLTAEAAHRSRVVTLQPHALPHTFTLMQFARVCAHLEPLTDPTSPDAGERMLEGVRIARSHVQPGPLGSDDIVDPIGRRAKVYKACADTIERAVAEIVGAFDPAVS